jgi:hypothetical protein
MTPTVWGASLPQTCERSPEHATPEIVFGHSQLETYCGQF